MDATEATEATDTIEATEATDATEATEATEASEATDATDAIESTKATEAQVATEFADAIDFNEATEAICATGTTNVYKSTESIKTNKATTNVTKANKSIEATYANEAVKATEATAATNLTKVTEVTDSTYFIDATDIKSASPLTEDSISLWKRSREMLERCEISTQFLPSHNLIEEMPSYQREVNYDMLHISELKDAISSPKNHELENKHGGYLDVFSSAILQSHNGGNDDEACSDAYNLLYQRVPVNEASAEDGAHTPLFDDSETSELDPYLLSISPGGGSPMLRADSGWVHKGGLARWSCTPGDDNKNVYEGIMGVEKTLNSKADSFDQFSEMTSRLANTNEKKQPCPCLRNTSINVASDFEQEDRDGTLLVKEPYQEKQLPTEDMMPSYAYEIRKESKHGLYFDAKSVGSGHILNKSRPKEELCTDDMSDQDKMETAENREPASVLAAVKNLNHSPSTPWKRLIEANIDSMIDTQRSTVDRFHSNNRKNQQDTPLNTNKPYDPPFVGCTDIQNTGFYKRSLQSVQKNYEDHDQQVVEMRRIRTSNARSESIDQSSIISCSALKDSGMSMISLGDNLILCNDSFKRGSENVSMKETSSEIILWSCGSEVEVCPSPFPSASDSALEDENASFLETNSQCQRIPSMEQLTAQQESGTFLTTRDVGETHSVPTADHSQGDSSSEDDMESLNSDKSYNETDTSFVKVENGEFTDLILESSDKSNVEAEMSISNERYEVIPGSVSIREIKMSDSENTGEDKICNISRGVLSTGYSEGSCGAVKNNTDNSLSQTRSLCPVEFSNELSGGTGNGDTPSVPAELSAMIRYGEWREAAGRGVVNDQDGLRSEDPQNFQCACGCHNNECHKKHQSRAAERPAHPVETLGGFQH
ncbi:hypothetical protein EGW08_013760 [Elysia chlorotica]|uniref:Uncharacterized protein n=1 Tax=Elysia chlorotica TaxID=188477 RepID=A0A3S0ZIC8_ELYCH|nr:hypothetical protein EGW08_013760 [Elysia chlorotica]